MKYIFEVAKDLSLLVDDIYVGVSEEGEEGGHGPGGDGDVAATAIVRLITVIRRSIDMETVVVVVVGARTDTISPTITIIVIEISTRKG